jgi:hypothetical protein
MTRALHTISATAFTATSSSAKTPARAFMIGVGNGSTGVRQGTDANAAALATRCALH